MRDGDDSVPFDDSDFHKGSGFIGADEHRHRVALHEVADGETKGMEHCLITDDMPVGAVEDDGLRLQLTSLLATRKLAKCKGRLLLMKWAALGAAVAAIAGFGLLGCTASVPEPMTTQSHAADAEPGTACPEQFLAWAELTHGVNRDAAPAVGEFGAVLAALPAPTCALGGDASGVVLLWLDRDPDALSAISAELRQAAHTLGYTVLVEHSDQHSELHNLGLFDDDAPVSRVVVQQHDAGSPGLRELSLGDEVPALSVQFTVG